MKTVVVHVPEKASSGYEIHIGDGVFSEIRSIVDRVKPSRVLMICDEAVRACSPAMTAAGFPFFSIKENGEHEKTPQVLEALWSEMINQKLDRSSVVIAVGGGTTCDVVGFAASTFMRGVKCINVPTTLLSQVDSSIGGKTGINLGKIKNIVGTFAPPAAVVIDFAFLKTLPPREFASGAAEVIKHGIIYSKDLWNKLCKTPLQKTSPGELEEIIVSSLEVKKEVVEKDPFEKGLRKILNFGHTVGHAYEAWSHEVGTPLLHGEAISIGMVAEAQLAVLLGKLGTESVSEIIAVLEAHALPVKKPVAEVAKLLSYMESDKKNRDGKILLSLPTSIGRCDFDVEAGRDQILKVLGMP